MSVNNHTNIILDLYKICDGLRDSRLWFLDELDANNYKEYHEKYSSTSKEKSHFIAVCGFFELSGTLIHHGLLDPDIFFDIFNPSLLAQGKTHCRRNAGNKTLHLRTL